MSTLSERYSTLIIGVVLGALDEKTGQPRETVRAITLVPASGQKKLRRLQDDLRAQRPEERRRNAMRMLQTALAEKDCDRRLAEMARQLLDALRVQA